MTIEPKNPFELPEITHNPNGWGPIVSSEDEAESVYFPFSKSDKIGKIADFLSKEHMKELGSKYNDFEDEGRFNLVDTQKERNTRTPTFRGRWNRRRNQPVRRPEAKKKELKGKQLKYVAQHTRRGKQWRRPRNSGYRRRYTRHTEASVKISADWDVVEQFDVNLLTKMQIQPPEAEELVVKGSLCYYNESYEKLTTRTSIKLENEKFPGGVFPATTTSDDPTLIGFAQDVLSGEKKDDEAFVFGTDELLTQIMVSTRSGFPWDITLTRLDGNIVLIDKREESKLHLDTVNETAPPLLEEEEKNLSEYNKKIALAEEATDINHTFRQQCLKYSKRKIFSEDNPLLEEPDSDEEVDATVKAAKKRLSVAHRYRKFKLGHISVYLRTELHAICKNNSKKQFSTVYAFNEWDSRLAKGMNWRQNVDNQRGGIIATELKNNAYKIGKWTARTLLADADIMKIGFVTRKTKTDHKNHRILAVQQFDPKILARQINLSKKNMWGIFKSIIDVVLKQDTGKYVLLKDPNRSFLRLYKLPLNEDVEGNEDEETDDDYE